MPLVNSPTLTPKKLAANRANAQLSRGPITLEGVIRVRDSKTKHGAYAQDRGEALPVADKGTNAADRMKSGAEVGGLTRSCFWPRRAQPGLVTPRGKVLLEREDASFRQVGRLTDLLLKLKREAWHARNQKMNIENEGRSHDVIDNKGPDFLSHDVTHNKAT